MEQSKIIIAHRGNIDGPNPDKENHPDYIIDAFKQCYHVEVDIWFINNKFVLGHDKPQYEVEDGFLDIGWFWFHAKTIETLSAILHIENIQSSINCFFHDEDDCTLTSNRWIWTFPNENIVSELSVAVMPERFPHWDISKAGAICTDFALKYAKEYGWHDIFYKE